PSLLRSRTLSNSTEPPLATPRRSTLITWPGATRYCLPPVAITASMATALSSNELDASAYETTPRPAESSRTPLSALADRLRWRSRPARDDLGGPQIVGQAVAEEQPRAVY